MILIKQCWIIFIHFLFLGCVSFGGPAAHIGYFKTTFVDKLQWLKNDEYAQLISLSQIMPGPGSSQIGFAIGLHKAGLLGGISAFIGFTFPSFFLMYFLALAADFNQPQLWLIGLTYGLKLLAVVVVLDAIISMFKSFCNTKIAMAIAAASAILLIVSHHPLSQLLVILISAAVGLLVNKGAVQGTFSANQLSLKAVSYWSLLLFLVLFVFSFVGWTSNYINMFAPYFQSGSLVFGGGHVVLPLLQNSVGNGLTKDAFVFGYAAAQGVPGPMFTIATFMGTLLNPSAPLTGAFIATLAIFLPGFLLILSLKSVWQSLLANRYFSGASWGINAGVVGLLIAAFYDPILTSAVTHFFDFLWVIGGILLLKIYKPHIFVLISIYLTLGLMTVYI